MKRSSLTLLAAIILLAAPMRTIGQTDPAQETNSPAVINPDVTFSPEDTIWLTDEENPVLPVGVTVSRTVIIKLRQHLDYVIQPPPVIVEVGARLCLELDEVFAGATEIQWMQNGEPAGTGESAFEVEMIPVGFESSYQARFQLNGREELSHGVTVVAGAFAQTPITNISTRSTISPSNPQVIVGLAIPSSHASGALTKTVLIRAVGQTLADYGVVNPLPDPTVRIFNSFGQDVTPLRAFAAVVYDDGTTPMSRYYEQVAAAAQNVGAFPIPLPGPESPPVSEYADLVSLPPGIYTIVVESDGGLSGDVLVEIYKID